jgi:hypothetical protein
MLTGRRRNVSSVAFATLAFTLAAAMPVLTVRASTTPGIAIAWEHPIPTESGTATVQAIAVLGSDVIVSGQVSGEVSGGTSAGSSDAWVGRFDSQGDVLWITQFGTDAADIVTSVAASESGIYVGGWTLGRFEPEPFDSERDFVARLTTSGIFQWAHETEESTTVDGAQVAVGADGDVFAALGDHTSGPNGTGYIASIRRYRSDGSLRWQRQITDCCGPTQPLGEVVPVGLVIDPGGVTVTGYSSGSVVPTILPGATGDFVQRYGYDGSVRWTSYLGAGPTSGSRVSRVGASEAGLWVAGTSAQPITGDPDLWPLLNPFVREYADSGAVRWTKAITATDIGRDCASILTAGSIPPDTTHGPGAEISRVRPDGTTEWRFEMVPAVEHLVVFHGVARSSERVFLGIERNDSQYSVAALTGVPNRADCDAQPPTVSSPVARFIPGSTLISTMPVRVSWTASDGGSGLAGFDLLEQVDSLAWATASERQVAAAATAGLRIGHAYRFRVRAVDRADRATSTIGATLHVVGRDDGSARVSYRGSWRRFAVPGAFGGWTHASSSTGASATFTFTARAIAWIAPISATRGAAKVYVDGRYVATVRLTASAFGSRRVVFATSWATEGQHTLRIVVAGTAGHPRIDVDAFVTLE